jgi:mono/diheme cytochrome c family protein
MEPFGRSLSDRQVAAVATFIRNGWENAHGLVLETAVQAVRDRRQRPLT